MLQVSKRATREKLLKSIRKAPDANLIPSTIKIPVVVPVIYKALHSMCVKYTHRTHSITVINTFTVESSILKYTMANSYVY